MSSKYSGRIHDPNHTLEEYDIYFNEQLIQTGTNYGRYYESMITRDGTSINIPDGVTKIGQNAFRGMSNLENVHIPDGLLKIQANAFAGCFSLREIYLPASINEITSTAFSSSYSNIVIKCGFSDGTVAGAPWSAPAGATILYDQDRPSANASENTNAIHSEMSNVYLINKPERPDVIDESSNIEEA